MLKTLARAILAEERDFLLERALRAEMRLAERDAVVADLSLQLSEAKALALAVPRTPDLPALFDALKVSGFSEEPFPDGKVPDNVWLTPSYPEDK